MKLNSTPTIYTIGHSTHSLDLFIAMLQSFTIELLADIRSLPGSRKFPQFDKENLALSLPQAGIEYDHLADLGGLRKAKKDSHNMAWHNASFRGYADYMETPEFLLGIEHLERLARQKKTAIMCSEAVWWRCHRSMVSDYLKSKGWNVLHIMSEGKSQEHSYTEPAKIINGKLSYAS
ncbi:MAG: DUF488 domain-containing protein [Bacteroidetes bacterium]|nr:DUF488 domain-containing protein [Bacteroidota bacterium]MBS1740423.1 DUF488 domain-containing protein [Bacteroidota bacterium]MBS1776122.1 DUF488 domain-containing protein [Bacteroidota bacterium]